MQRFGRNGKHGELIQQIFYYSLAMIDILLSIVISKYDKVLTQNICFPNPKISSEQNKQNR